jgi:hypothetical protein
MRGRECQYFVSLTAEDGESFELSEAPDRAAGCAVGMGALRRPRRRAQRQATEANAQGGQKKKGQSDN